MPAHEHPVVPDPAVLLVEPEDVHRRAAPVPQPHLLALRVQVQIEPRIVREDLDEGVPVPVLREDPDVDVPVGAERSPFPDQPQHGAGGEEERHPGPVQRITQVAEGVAGPQSGQGGGGRRRGAVAREQQLHRFQVPLPGRLELTGAGGRHRQLPDHRQQVGRGRVRPLPPGLRHPGVLLGGVAVHRHRPQGFRAARMPAHRRHRPLLRHPPRSGPVAQLHHPRGRGRRTGPVTQLGRAQRLLVPAVESEQIGAQDVDGGRLRVPPLQPGQGLLQQVVLRGAEQRLGRHQRGRQ